MQQILLLITIRPTQTNQIQLVTYHTKCHSNISKVTIVLTALNTLISLKWSEMV